MSRPNPDPVFVEGASPAKCVANLESNPFWSASKYQDQDGQTGNCPVRRRGLPPGIVLGGPGEDVVIY